MSKDNEKTQTTAAPLYSGRILSDQPGGEDLFGVYLHMDDDGVMTLRIESGQGHVRAMLILDKRQARSLRNCLHNGLERWEGREP